MSKNLKWGRLRRYKIPMSRRFSGAPARPKHRPPARPPTVAKPPPKSIPLAEVAERLKRRQHRAKANQ
jgi:hypothetical protein